MKNLNTVVASVLIPAGLLTGCDGLFSGGSTTVTSGDKTSAFDASSAQDSGSVVDTLPTDSIADSEVVPAVDTLTESETDELPIAVEPEVTSSDTDELPSTIAPVEVNTEVAHEETVDPLESDEQIESVEPEEHFVQVDGVYCETVEITLSDGAQMLAIVARPKGEGPFPVVVMPSSLTTNFLVYTAPAKELAWLGYTVVSYTSRGMYEADGYVDAGDRRTVQDVSEVIDWAIEHHHGDENRIAAGGLSYGAGTSLLAAARDPRIDAVFAMAGWTDMRESFYFNDTVSEASLLFGDFAVRLTSDFSSELETVLDELEHDSVSEYTLTQLFPVRSPAKEIDALNGYRPALLQVASWNDTFFPPNQLFDFYSQYQGEYRLVMNSDGDHATNEITGLLGIPNDSWDETYDWLNVHLMNRSSSARDGRARFFVENAGDSIVIDDVAELPVTELHYEMDAPDRAFFFGAKMGNLSTDIDDTDWRVTLKGGLETGADSIGISIAGPIGDFLINLFDFEFEVSTSSLARNGAAVWRGEAMTENQTILGIPKLKLHLAPSESDSTIMVYLYDEDEHGDSTMISHAPFSQRGVSSEAKLFEIPMHARTYELKKGHRLVVALDTVDEGYKTRTGKGETIDVLSTTESPALLTVPFLNR